MLQLAQFLLLHDEPSTSRKSEEQHAKTYCHDFRMHSKQTYSGTPAGPAGLEVATGKNERCSKQCNLGLCMAAVFVIACTEVNSVLGVAIGAM